jgi:hypothetical protein
MLMVQPSNWVEPVELRFSDARRLFSSAANIAAAFKS